eukprot:TRINITY_DN47581_c0_g3_i1.p2 TRINITY_DN47581_c0_g3~~TRINITY_DN47581_c0_g3_i1.p2  ORF type:complete len:62 (-),score=7.34 TRINITY_DN47581_c0_g3_i1:124-309(-)
MVVVPSLSHKNSIEKEVGVSGTVPKSPLEIFTLKTSDGLSTESTYETSVDATSQKKSIEFT